MDDGSANGVIEVTKIEAKSSTEAEAVDEDDNGWKSGISIFACDDTGANTEVVWTLKSEKGC